MAGLAKATADRARNARSKLQGAGDLTEEVLVVLRLRFDGLVPEVAAAKLAPGLALALRYLSIEAARAGGTPRHLIDPGPMVSVRLADHMPLLSPAAREEAASFNPEVEPGQLKRTISSLLGVTLEEVKRGGLKHLMRGDLTDDEFEAAVRARKSAERKAHRASTTPEDKAVANDIRREREAAAKALKGNDMKTRYRAGDQFLADAVGVSRTAVAEWRKAGREHLLLRLAERLNDVKRAKQLLQSNEDARKLRENRVALQAPSGAELREQRVAVKSSDNASPSTPEFREGRDVLLDKKVVRHESHETPAVTRGRAKSPSPAIPEPTPVPVIDSPPLFDLETALANIDKSSDLTPASRAMSTLFVYFRAAGFADQFASVMNARELSEDAPHDAKMEADTAITLLRRGMHPALVGGAMKQLAGQLAQRN